jgi:hypothetical protein
LRKSTKCFRKASESEMCTNVSLIYGSAEPTNRSARWMSTLKAKKSSSTIFGSQWFFWLKHSTTWAKDGGFVGQFTHIWEMNSFKDAFIGSAA